MSKSDVQSIVERMQVPERDRLFVLGCFERPATLYMQQVRALNLVYSLSRSGLPRDTSVAVIGAGAAGVTAAAAGAIHGWDVTVLDHHANDVLSFSGSTTNQRWLHPHIYDWPEDDKDEPRAGLCILDWTAGTAEKVVASLRQQWKKIQARWPIDTHLGVSNVALAPMGGRYFLQWNGAGPQGRELGGRRLRAKAFDVVILAVGFGMEESTPDFPLVHSYWETDNLNRSRTQSISPEIVLVSGTGDGGLIDILRLSFNDFRHDEVLARLRNEWLAKGELERVRLRLQEIETRARAQRADGAPYEAELNHAYHLLADSLKYASASRIQLRTDVVPVLTGKPSLPLTLEAAVLNRFLFLLSNAQYIPGPLRSAHPNPQGAAWTVELEGQSQMARYADVVIRHGPKSALQRFFPDIYAACAPLAKATSLVLDRTRLPQYDDSFVQHLSDAWRSIQDRNSVPLAEVQAAVRRAGADTLASATLEELRASVRGRVGVLRQPLVERHVTQLSDRGDLSRDAYGSADEQQRVSLEWLLNEPAVRLIVGERGSGTSALLLELSAQVAADVRYLPLFVDARDIANEKDTDVFVAAIDLCLAPSSKSSTAEIEAVRQRCLALLAMGRAVLFLDGLDELPLNDQTRLVGALATASRIWSQANRVVVASRGSVVSRDFPGSVFQLMPIDEKGMLDIITRRFGPQPAQHAMAALRAHPGLAELVTTPRAVLTFAMLNDRPGDARDAYQLTLRIIDLWLADMSQETRDPLLKSMEVLALHCTRNGVSLPISLEEILSVFKRHAPGHDTSGWMEFLVSRSLLIADNRDAHVFWFANRLVWDCLAAHHLLRMENPVTPTLALAFTENGEASEAPAIALGQVGDPAVFALLADLPDSLDRCVLRLRARVMRYSSSPPLAEVERLAQEVRDVVAERAAGADDVLREIASAFAGVSAALGERVMMQLDALLQSDTAHAQWRAIVFLSRARPAGVVATIARSLASTYEQVRTAAAATLGELGDPTGLPPLLAAAMHPPDRLVFEPAYRAVAQIGGEQACEALVGILNDRSLFENFRWPAADALGNFGEKTAIAALVRATEDPSTIVRAHAVEALGRVPTDDVVSLLIARLGDSEPSVRAAAAAALGAHPASGATASLVAALSDAHHVVRQAAVAALSRLDAAVLVETLRAVIADPGSVWRGDAAALLGSLLGVEALETLLLLTRDDDESVRVGAAEGLALIRHADAAAALLLLAQDGAETVRCAAAKALGGQDLALAAPALSRILGADESELVRSSAARALRNVPDAASAVALARALQEDDLSRFEAALSLAAVAGESAVVPLVAAWRRSPADRQFKSWLSTAFAKVDGAGMVAAVRELFVGEDARGRVTLLHNALRRMRHPATIPMLLIASADDSAEVRTVAHETLRSAIVEQLMPGLVLAFADTNPMARMRAAQICPFYIDGKIETLLIAANRSDADARVKEAAGQALQSLARRAVALGLTGTSLVDRPS